MRLMITPAGGGSFASAAPCGSTSARRSSRAATAPACGTGFSRRIRQAISAAPAGSNAMAATMPVATLSGCTVPPSLAEMNPVHAMTALNTNVPSADGRFFNHHEHPCRDPVLPRRVPVRVGQIHCVAEHGIESEHQPADGQTLKSADDLQPRRGLTGGDQKPGKHPSGSIIAAQIRPRRRPIRLAIRTQTGCDAIIARVCIRKIEPRLKSDACSTWRV